jgi:diketogulonate reductase-like aldo/keto reductase
MEERRLGPIVGLGTWATFGGDVQTARTVVGAALAEDCRIIDSSPMYGEAERSLAGALAGRREQATVATKIWASSVTEGKEQFEQQLRWYGKVDVEQVHNLVRWREHIAWLADEQAAARVGRLGVTHYDPAAFGDVADALRTGSFQTVQLPYNPLERECERMLLPLAAELGIAVIVMRPLGGRNGPLLRRRPNERELAPLREFGIQTWAQALLKWALSDERVDVVIPATSSAGRVLQNAAAGSPPWLGPDERSLVEHLAGL